MFLYLAFDMGLHYLPSWKEIDSNMNSELYWYEWYKYCELYQYFQ
jgi:hypothetical protein